MSKLAATQVLYRERVTPNWTSFLPLVLILPTFWLTFAPINTAVGISSGIGVTVIVAALMISNSPVISVSKGSLRLGKATLELKFAGKAVSIPKESQFAERGPKLDSRAFLALQSSKNGLIRLEISDPKDPTPYWLFSTARPDELLEAIKAARS